MKHIVSVSLGEDTIVKMRERLRLDKSFRSKSHLVEEAVRRLWDSGVKGERE